MSDKTFTIKYGYGNSNRTKEYPLSLLHGAKIDLSFSYFDDRGHNWYRYYDNHIISRP